MNREFDNSLPKIERQISLFMLMYDEEAFHGRREVFHRGLASNLRMLQRDMRDLTDAGLLKMKYDAQHDQYIGKTIQTEKFEINPEATGRRRQHLLRLHRLCVLLYDLEGSESSVVEDYEDSLYYYQEDLKDARIHPEEYSEDELIKPELPRLSDARDSYRHLFPECCSKTMHRDFEMLKKFGVEVKYYPRYKVYLIS